MLRSCMLVVLSTQVWVSESRTHKIELENALNNDIAYYRRVALGGQKVKIMFDTTVSHSWLPSTTALTGRSTKRTTDQRWPFGHYDIDAEKSDTLTEVNRTSFKESLGEGPWVTDKLTKLWDNMETRDAFDFEFVLINKLNNMKTFEPKPYDGVFGLGFDEEGKVPLLEALVDAEQIDERVFALHLGRRASGHLHLQEPDQNSFSEDLRKIGLEEGATSWSVPLDAVWFGDNDISLELPSAVFHPASPFVIGPTRDTNRFMSRWGAKKYMQYYKVDCETDGPSLAFRFDGRDYTLWKEDLILKFRETCFLAVKSDPNAKAWTLGAPFHRKFYTAFYAAEKRVGLAKARHD